MQGRFKGFPGVHCLVGSRAGSAIFLFLRYFIGDHSFAFKEFAFVEKKFFAHVVHGLIFGTRDELMNFSFCFSKSPDLLLILLSKLGL